MYGHYLLTTQIKLKPSALQIIMFIISKNVNTVCVEKHKRLAEQFDGAYPPVYLL